MVEATGGRAASAGLEVVGPRLPLEAEFSRPGVNLRGAQIKRAAEGRSDRPAISRRNDMIGHRADAAAEPETGAARTGFIGFDDIIERLCFRL